MLSVLYRAYERTPLDNVYQAMHNKDLSDCVVSALKLLRETNNLMDFKIKKKSSVESLETLAEGKKALLVGGYQMALLKYNMALMRAPYGSEAMCVAYFNRAELLLKIKQYLACVNDIETCLAFNCSEVLAKELREMKEEASKYVIMETFAREQMSSPFSKQFFKLNDHNNDIPCASSDVEVIMESGQPKVVAAKDIPVGKVLALETAFVGANHIMNHVSACHYCHKMSFNLIPCADCCAALFCDNACKEQAMQQGHNVECKIIDIILDDIALPVKAVIKMRQMCSSWDEFITASSELGMDRIVNSSKAEMFGSKKFSLLHSHREMHFIYGAMFNKCMYVANIIHHLDTKTTFLPKQPEDKSAAIQAVSRVLMHLSLYCTPVQLQLVTSIARENQTTLHNHPNKGYFPFIGTLENSCQPNSYVAGLRNSAALISLMPIKEGAEITIPYLGHWLEVFDEKELRQQKLYIHYKTVCKECLICSGDKILNAQPLNDIQKKAFKTFLMADFHKVFRRDTKLAYTRVCKTMTSLSEAPFSSEYKEVFKSFICCLMRCSECQYPNVIMERYE